MIKRLAPVALVLAACSPEGTNASAPANAATEGAAAEEGGGATAAPGTAAADVAPKPGALKTFRDWTVGCDNGAACKMASLGPEAGDFPAVTMSVARAAGPDGGWTIELTGNEKDPAALAIDGKKVASGATSFSGTEAAAIVAAMANGKAATALDGTGKAMATISLAGASAALRYIDAEQGRADGVTAAVAKGAKPASAVPVAPALPVVTAIAPEGTAAKPSAAQVTEMRKTAGCDLEGFAGQTDPDAYALGGGATLVFVPCSAGAYNVSSALFVLKDDKVSPARADVATGFTEDGQAEAVAQVVNGDFDKGFVNSYAKGRGIGDCGVSQTLAWDGTRLRLTEQSEMGECRGNTDTITTWRTTVTRR
jgi:hypothetical protein